MEESGKSQHSYIPTELVNCSSNNTCLITYHCYLIEMNQDFKYNHVSVRDVVLAIRSELDKEIISTSFKMCIKRGNLSVNLRHVQNISLSSNEVQNCRRFQTTIFRILLNRKISEIKNISDDFNLENSPEIDYLLLPATVKELRHSNSIIDWKCVSSENTCECEDNALVWTKNDLVCSCKLKNCVVFTPHNDFIYFIDGVMDLNGNSPQLHQRGRGNTTYKEYFKNRGIELKYEHQSLLRGRKDGFKVANYLQKSRKNKEKGPSMSSYELPPELCIVIMSPIAINIIYSFSFIPSIMHRLQSLLVAFSLKNMLMDHCKPNDIPLCKVLEAITAKECQEEFDYDSLETLGDSFLKYIVSQQLFKTKQDYREGRLTDERKKIVSNPALFRHGCSRKLPGFIQNDFFNPKEWVIPGDKSKSMALKEELVFNKTRIYANNRTKNIRSKIVSDVVEALIGAFLSTGDEEAALSFINWIGIKVDTNFIPNENHFGIVSEKIVKLNVLESLLNYSFQDPSLLVEALTHGSYNQCYNYQRLEFLGDAVLDYLITKHFYDEYHSADKLSSGLLTDMRSISVNNECYALSAIRAKLDEHILCDSVVVAKQITDTKKNVEKLSLKSTFGWELETYFSQVLADVIESIAGAIFVDSGYKKEIVFQSIRPILEPLVTPETAKQHPIRELTELCQGKHYQMKEPTIMSHDNGVTSVTIEVKVNGTTYKDTAQASNKNTAQKLASKNVLKLINEGYQLKVVNKDKNICIPFIVSILLVLLVVFMMY